jgi:pimeloyl-ACP methyl ester carboxylesterase
LDGVRRSWCVRVVFAVLAGACALPGCDGEADRPLRAHSLRVDGREHLTVDPGSPRRPLLVLLHGRGMSPRDLLWKELYDELERLGEHAPAVVLVDGGDHSYYHDRRDYTWGRSTLRVVDAAERGLGTDGRVAVGGISMGGFGAFDLARRRAFCAVGGHSPALFRSAAATPAGAFDDAEDFARHDVIAAARSGDRFGGARLWLDVGREDPFRAATVELGRLLKAPVHVWAGGHDTHYWRAHVDEYLRFYSDALERCRR